ncbi:MAG: hypothetical protein H6660_15955 [Ardenticatenaceae bacterium]|nr:hypothetical protein [Ardenticatenaceae bacterium]
MSKQTIYLNKQRHTLDAAQLIQSGGEGMVFALGNDTAVKLYHAPQAQHAAKLTHMCDSGLAQRLPAGVLGPQTLVTDKQGNIIGFQMPKLPADTHALKRLATPLFWQKQSLTLSGIIQLFQTIHATLAQLHQLGVIVGDLNDQNLFFLPGAPHTAHPVFWLDVDSYQYGRFPCPVAMLPFLDPQLYHVADFSQQPVFSDNSDWYAYFVLLIKSILHVHPYGGVHKQHKSLQSRAQAGVTILDNAITYPANARPPETLSDDLLHHLHRTFAQGQRGAFPLSLLTAYAADLTTCTHCGQPYPRSRSHCPTCRLVTPVPQPLLTGALRELLHVDGFIEYVRVMENGRFLVISHHNNTYTLHRLGMGGTREELVLFNGRSGYRFAIFQPEGSAPVLAVNPPGGTQLLLLDISGTQPRKLTMLETATFRDTAVFAATPHHLMRIAGTWLMRGSFRDGLYVEDAIATAHQQQTTFWAAPHSDTIAGYHRVFAEVRYWLWHNGRSYDLPIPPLAVGESLQETAVAFAADTIAFTRAVRQRDHVRHETHIVDGNGRLIHHLPGTESSHYPFTTNPALPVPPFHLLPSTLPVSPDDILHAHPHGIIIQQADRIQAVSL